MERGAWGMGRGLGARSWELEAWGLGSASWGGGGQRLEVRGQKSELRGSG